ncbi:DUF1203 domain-containing protein [Roseomonas elaeocarpi]|uniref:DUF1203 domain-containing protein n=1 Tax=Roseomonas elaeocarpi TaxID=907779 RepID=A0ABV6JNQ5_9PROT
MMFRCVPVDTTVAERFRREGRDDRGGALRRMRASGSGFPCRHCLQLATEGEEVLLGSYDLPRPRGIYWTPSPIFLHAGPCERFRQDDVLAPVVLRNPLVSVRAYDAADQCLYALGEVCDGAMAEVPLLRALRHPDTAFVNIHTARPGCLLTRVEKPG